MKITFSHQNRIGQADKMIYGHFLEHFHRQVYGGVYDPTSKFADEDGFRTDVLDALRRIKTPIIRWPGGCYVSAYDWHFGVGRERIPTYDKAWRVEESNEFGTDEFIKLCRKLDCEPYICTNAGTGTPEQMSNWVEYCNLKDMGPFAKERIANGYPEPHRIKYWSIGNENWGRHEMGSKDADEWGRLVRESAKMMLRVDPTLELSAASIGSLDWNLNLLRTAGDFLDWISLHGYWASPAADGLTFPDYRTLMLRTGTDISNQIEQARAHLVSLGLEKRVKISFDEWNLRAWYHPNVMDIYNRAPKRNEDEEFYQTQVIGARSKNDVNAVYTMADAVFSASFLNLCLRNCDIVGMACFSPVVNTRGAIFTYENGIVLRPTFFVFELYANLLKETVLDIWSEGVPTLRGMDGNKQKTVDTVDIAVSVGDGEYAIAAVNKDAEQEQTLDLRLLDGTPTQMRLHVLNGPSPDAYNDIDRTEVGVVTSEWMPYAETVTLPPHSVSVIEIR